MTKAGLILRALIGDIEAVKQRTTVESPIDRISSKVSEVGPSREGTFRKLHAPQVENGPASQAL